MHLTFCGAEGPGRPPSRGKGAGRRAAAGQVQLLPPAEDGPCLSSHPRPAQGTPGLLLWCGQPAFCSIHEGVWLRCFLRELSVRTSFALEAIVHPSVASVNHARVRSPDKLASAAGSEVTGAGSRSSGVPLSFP